MLGELAVSGWADFSGVAGDSGTADSSNEVEASCPEPGTTGCSELLAPQAVMIAVIPAATMAVISFLPFIRFPRSRCASCRVTPLTLTLSTLKPTARGEGPRFGSAGIAADQCEKHGA